MQHVHSEPEIWSLTRRARTRVGGASPTGGEAIPKDSRSEERLPQPLLTGTKSRIFFPDTGCRVTPAQGSVKPTVGFTLKLSSFLSGPLGDHFGGAQFIYLAAFDSGFAQNFVGVLAELGRHAPHFHWGFREASAGAHRAHLACGGMIVNREAFVLDDFRILQQRFVVVNRAAWDVGSLEHWEPFGGILFGEKLSETAHEVAPALGTICSLRPKFGMPYRFGQ